MSSLFLENISFPVFLLGKEKPIVENGEAYYLRIDERDDDLAKELRLIVDAKVPGSTLARRRLYLKNKGFRLFNLAFGIFFIADLIKFTKGLTWFIDSTGKIFSYKKSKNVPLIFKKIDRVIPLPRGGGIVEIEGIRYKTLFLPKLEHQYAGLLKLNNYYILYGTYDNKLKDTTRKI